MKKRIFFILSSLFNSFQEDLLRSFPSIIQYVMWCIVSYSVRSSLANNTLCKTVKSHQVSRPVLFRKSFLSHFFSRKNYFYLLFFWKSLRPLIRSPFFVKYWNISYFCIKAQTVLLQDSPKFQKLGIHKNTGWIDRFEFFHSNFILPDSNMFGQIDLFLFITFGSTRVFLFD